MLAGFGFGVIAGHRVTIAHAASIVRRSTTPTNPSRSTSDRAHRRLCAMTGSQRFS